MKIATLKLKTKISGMSFMLLMITMIVSGSGIINMRNIGAEIEAIADEGILLIINTTEVVIDELG